MGAPIVLFCDFGLPYTGQMKSRLLCDAPNTPVIDLFHDVPAYDIQAGSVLLSAYVSDFPKGTIFVCVVDPGVGSDQRKSGAVFAGGRWFVGPLNGLFEHVLRRYEEGAKAFEITWAPESLSSTFHGRDLFAPVAAQLANGDLSGLLEVELDTVRHKAFDDDIKALIYIDQFGNIMTGIRAESLKDDETIEIRGCKMPRFQTFSDTESGAPFVYENSVGLMEISTNQGNAFETLEISAFYPLKIVKV